MKEVTIALINNLAPILASVATLVGVFFMWRSNRQAQKADKKELQESIKEVHILINSRMTELLDVTGKSKKAEGVLEGRNEIK